MFIRRFTDHDTDKVNALLRTNGVPAEGLETMVAEGERVVAEHDQDEVDWMQRLVCFLQIQRRMAFQIMIEEI